MTDQFSWRWVFWMNLPISLVPLAALIYALPSFRRPGKVRIDYLGIMALVTGLVPILVAITWLGEQYTFTSGRVMIFFLFGVVVLGLFIWQEFCTDEPIINPAFFRSGIFVTAMVASFCLALGMYGAIMFVPLFVQGVVGTSAQNSGVVLAPMMGGFIVGSTISGQLVSRWGRYRILALVGLSMAVVGMFLFARMDVHSSNLTVIRNMIVLGIGIGSTLPLFTIAVQNAFPYSVMGSVTAARQFFMSLGGAVGVPIMGALLTSGFQSQFGKHLSSQLRGAMQREGALGLDPNSLISADAQSAIHRSFLHLGPSGQSLYSQFIFAVRDSLALTMQGMFRLALGFLLAALIVTTFLREIPLKKRHDEPELAVADTAAAVASAPEPLTLRTERAD